MSDEFRYILSAEAVIPDDVREVRPVAAAYSFAPEAAAVDPVSRRPFVNDRRNSRLSQSVPAGEWVARTVGSMEPGLRPRHILHAADRIIVQGDGPWQLFDNHCQSLARGYLDGSDVFLDAENGVFFFSDPAGMLEARNLHNGNRAFSASLMLGAAYYRSLITRRGGRMVVVSSEREIDQDSEEKPRDSTIELLKFNDPPEIDSDGVLRSAEVVADLRRETLTLLTALGDETLVAVTDDRIFLIDLDLRIRHVLQGTFEPLALSLSDAGVIYLVVSDGGVLALRAIAPTGERLFSAELPEGLGLPSCPPIIGYDSRVYLLWRNRLMAFSQGGILLWEYKSPNPFGGAVVTADHELIVTCGSELGVYDSAGKYRLLYEFAGDSLQTPPALTAAGDLVAASDEKLYCLTIRKP